MGNTASSTVSAAEVLSVTASEEKERGEPAPTTDQSAPGDEDLRAWLLMLGVDLGDTPMPGQKAHRCRGDATMPPLTDISCIRSTCAAVVDFLIFVLLAWAGSIVTWSLST